MMDGSETEMRKFSSSSRIPLCSWFIWLICINTLWIRSAFHLACCAGVRCVLSTRGGQWLISWTVCKFYLQLLFSKACWSLQKEALTQSGNILFPYAKYAFILAPFSNMSASCVWWKLKVCLMDCWTWVLIILLEGKYRRGFLVCLWTLFQLWDWKIFWVDSASKFMYITQYQSTTPFHVMASINHDSWPCRDSCKINVFLEPIRKQRICTNHRMMCGFQFFGCLKAAKWGDSRTGVGGKGVGIGRLSFQIY